MLTTHRFISYILELKSDFYNFIRPGKINTSKLAQKLHAEFGEDSAGGRDATLSGCRR